VPSDPAAASPLPPTPVAGPRTPPRRTAAR
jgi:hypothetical protein